MTVPAVSAALDAVVAKVEAIAPTIDPAQPFRRRSEITPPSTAVGKRTFDVEFQGHSRDQSNEGPAGVQNVGIADRVASFDLVVDYARANAERALETTMAVDSELVLRALNRASWAGTPVHRVVARSRVERPEAGEGQPGVFSLVVSADVHYRDTE